MQIIGAVLRVGERPIGLRAPAVNAHHKERDRRLLVHAVVRLLQPAVEPAELEAGQVKRLAAGGRAELALRETAGEVRVAPGADEYALVPARVFGASKLSHALIVLERAPQEDIIPPADVERRGSDLLVASTGGHRAPVRVRCRVGQPVMVEGRSIPDQRMVGERQVGQYGVQVQTDSALRRLPATRHAAPDLAGNDVLDQPPQVMEHLRAALIRRTLVHVREGDRRRHRL